jgi:glycosyltransferase involved in cell wall biosynthesis
MNNPLLHVVIPAYGESPYLRQTLISAIKCLPLEVPITVIEDLSPEETNIEKLVKEFPRVQYHKNSNRLGIGGNFNKAIEISTGVFTQICGYDDIFIGNPLELSAWQKVITDDIAVVAFDVKIINKRSEVVRTTADLIKGFLRPKLDSTTVFNNKYIFSNLMLGDWFYFPAILWRTNTIKQIQFDANLHTAMDLDILIRLLNKDKKIVFVKNKVVGYRRHHKSASSLYAKSIGRVEEEFLCHKKALEFARNKNWKTGAFLAQLALTVRLHALMQSFLMVFTSPPSALKVFAKAISPIR